MSARCSNFESYQLLHHGALALGQVEANGIKIDLQYLQDTRASISKEIKGLQTSLRESKVGKLWRRKYGSKFSIQSDDQLVDILHEELGYPVLRRTDSDRPAATEEALAHIPLKFLKGHFRLKKLNKIRSTYLNGIEKHVMEDGFLRPSFSLHIARTFRSTSQNPNFQNLPIRDAELGALVRRCFIPRNGHRHIVEIDYSAIEVRVSACYHKDPVMISYIEDKTKDMHRDMAAECYMVEPEQVCKQARYGAKNKFVFPQFYGDYYGNCATALWNHIEEAKLEVGGVSMSDHLRSKGITSLGDVDPKKEPAEGTFAKHIKEVETHFWQVRFRKYNRWKKDWWENYQRTGSFDTLTGFVYNGLYLRKETINYPVQGSAFHCLLWSLTVLNRELRKRKMRSVIIGQIHDSIVADVHEEELETYLQLAQEVMTKRLRRAWSWIIVPLEVEAEVAPAGASWAEKKGYEIA